MLLALNIVSAARHAAAQAIVPGTGHRVAEVGDDFEDPKWNYIANLPKSSQENDGQARLPGGVAANGRWFEPEMRGAPDVVKRVDTPPDGIPGSKGSMLMKTLFSGVPGKPSFKVQQDDFVANVASKIGTTSVSRSPSVVTRVYLPPFDEWEKRTGNSFGFRAAALTTINKSSGRWFGGSFRKAETYWPGMFIWFNSKSGGQNKEDSARFMIRADELGHDVWGPEIKQTGWWTLGMSFSPDGKVHYFIKSGVDNLTSKDFVATYNPYGYHCEHLETLFFDVLNMDDGKSWSTEWIVDDPSLYVDGSGVK
ncbi:MAG TPA: hypothetical protein VG056_12595 [Pirellulales bacterium]|nr:hypothetical protein [Pirellulales bacterium]